MELGQVRRPRGEVDEYQDMEPRKKCTFCCGLRCAAIACGTALLITLPCNAVMTRGRLTDGKGLLGFLNRNMLVPLPLAAIAFTHHVILSESLWGRNKKTVFEINWQSALSNILLWTTGVAVCTVLSRRYLPSASRSYRLLLWEYHRVRRGCANPYLPSVFGRVTEDLDWYNILFTLSIYHLMWGMLSVSLEKNLGAHYAMLFRDMKFSKWCSPRWREWREVQVMRNVQTEQQTMETRWGTFLTNNRWRVRSN